MSGLGGTGSGELIGAREEDRVRYSCSVAVGGVGVGVAARVGVDVDDGSAPEVFNRGGERDGGGGGSEQELAAIDHCVSGIRGAGETQLALEPAVKRLAWMLAPLTGLRT